MNRGEIGFEFINMHFTQKIGPKMFGLGLFWDLGGWTTTIGKLQRRVQDGHVKQTSGRAPSSSERQHGG